MHIVQSRIQNIETTYTKDIEDDYAENVRDLALIETMKQAIQDIYNKYPHGLEVVSTNRNGVDDNDYDSI